MNYFTHKSVFFGFIILLTSILLTQTPTHGQTSGSTEDILLSQNGKQYIVINKDSADRYEVTFNQKKIGPMDKIMYTLNNQVRFSEDNSNFYLPVRAQAFQSGFISKNGFTGPLRSISDNVVFHPNGLIYAYVKDKQLFIHTPDEEIATGHPATNVGKFKWSEGEYIITYRNEKATLMTTSSRTDSLFPSYYVSNDRIVIKPNREAIGVIRKDKQQYVAVSASEIAGPYEKVSEMVSYQPQNDWTGFAYQKDGKGYVWVNGETFGPYPSFRMASKLQFTGDEKNEFAYYYLTEDKQLFIQSEENRQGPIHPEGLRGSRPVLGQAGKNIRLSPSTPRGDFVQINNDVYGPFGKAPRFFYKNKVYENHRVFRFYKHGKAFLYADGHTAGPFEAVDFTWNGRKLTVASVKPGDKTVQVKKYRKRQLRKLPVVQNDTRVHYSAKLKDAELAFPIPYSWHSTNLFEKTRFLPMLLASPEKVDVQKLVNSIDEKKLPENIYNILIISHYGNDYTNEQMKKMLVEGTVFEADTREIEPVQNIPGNLNGFSRSIEVLRDKPVIINQYAFKKDNQWLMCFAYADQKQAPFFEDARNIMENIQVK